jgi:ribonuclease H2 subunit B
LHHICHSLILPSILSLEILEVYFKTIENEAASLAIDTKSNAKGQNILKVGGEDKKRKTAKGSQGVEKLKKVNVNGMAKLSSFFKKS